MKILDSSKIVPISNKDLEQLYVIPNLRISSYQVVGKVSRYLVIKGAKKYYLLDLIDLYLNSNLITISKLDYNYYVKVPRNLLIEVELI